MTYGAIRGASIVVMGALLLAAASARAGEGPAKSTSATAVVEPVTTGPLGNDAEAVELLRRLEEQHKAHSRASGTFRQTRTDPVFLEDIKATGRFYYERPNRFRCDYDKPEESTTWVIGDEVTMYFPALKQVEKYRMKRDGSDIGEMNQMLLAFGIETDKVLEHFTVRTTPTKQADLVRLVFLPKASPPERPFERFDLALTRSDLAPKPGEETFLIVGAERDLTSVEITGINWNPPAEPEKFRLKFPRNVEIIEEDYRVEDR